MMPTDENELRLELMTFNQLPKDYATLLIKQFLQNQELRKVIEARLDMAKTLKDDYMIQLFTDILRH